MFSRIISFFYLPSGAFFCLQTFDCSVLHDQHQPSRIISYSSLSVCFRPTTDCQANQIPQLGGAELHIFLVIIKHALSLLLTSSSAVSYGGFKISKRLANQQWFFCQYPSTNASGLISPSRLIVSSASREPLFYSFVTVEPSIITG